MIKQNNRLNREKFQVLGYLITYIKYLMLFNLKAIL